MKIQGKILRNPSEEELNEFLLNVKKVVSFQVVIAKEVVEVDKMFDGTPINIMKDIHYVYIIYIPN